MLFEGGVIKPVAFPLSDLGDPLLADAIRLFGVEQCIAQFGFSGFQYGDLVADVGYLVGRVTIGHRGEGGCGFDFHWFVSSCCSPGFDCAAHGSTLVAGFDRFLVASQSVRDLLFCAKLLFVAAMVAIVLAEALAHPHQLIHLA